jgi:uncharacterized protein (TIGR00730 family)
MAPSPSSVCVFCGSRFGTEPAYRTAARDLGSALAKAGFRVVYGAGDVGLMGEVANAAQNAGGDTFGVIPVHLLEKEAGKRDLTRFIITENMHERKKVMFMNADAIVTLPGGAGSLDEFFEVLTWAQLGVHSKPIEQGFADPSLKELFQVKESVPALMAALGLSLCMESQL